MLASVVSHAPLGVEGQLVSVEVDLRRGIPGIDMVGLPDGAVRESRERVRVAIRNSGFKFPRDRVLVNLAPAGIRKEGASFDLAIALAILAASGQIPAPVLQDTVVLGELNLSGKVQRVHGVIAAVESGLRAGKGRFIVPRGNAREAFSLGQGRIDAVSSLDEARRVVIGELSLALDPDAEAAIEDHVHGPDFADVRGHELAREALELAAAGRHNIMLFGPPGSGKTMSARCLPSILPPLTPDESLEVTRIHSIAGALSADAGLLTRRPFRAPHHSASTEGIVGGGRYVKPGEVSLAHRGVLFLDETMEYNSRLLQSLREPTEDGWVTIVRAGLSVRYPAAFQLVMTANACPCGGLGKQEGTCACSDDDVQHYWKRLGFALLDRVDIRVPVKPIETSEMLGACGEPSAPIAARVRQAAEIQRRRYHSQPFSWNAEIPAGRVGEFCSLSKTLTDLLLEGARRSGLSSRGVHSILKVARTAADLAGHDGIEKPDLETAIKLRLFGEPDRKNGGVYTGWRTG